MVERVAASGGNPWVEWRAEREGKPLSWWMSKIFGEGPVGVTCATCRSFSSQRRKTPGGFWTVHGCAASSGGGQWEKGWAACGNYQAQGTPGVLALPAGEGEKEHG